MPQNTPEGYSPYQYDTMGAGGGQRQLYDYLKNMAMNQGGKGMQNMFGIAAGDQDLFGQLEAPAMRQFQQQIAPGIANRYTGAGMKGSSGFENALSSAGSNLAENLQGQRMKYQMSAMDRVMHLMEMLTGMKTEQTGLSANSKGTDWGALTTSALQLGAAFIPGAGPAVSAGIGAAKSGYDATQRKGIDQRQRAYNNIDDYSQYNDY